MSKTNLRTINKPARVLSNVDTSKRVYHNIVEATRISDFIKLVSGLLAYRQTIDVTNTVRSHLDYAGTIVCLSYLLAYIISGYKIIKYDQTILRSLFDTKLGTIGDMLERFLALFFVIYVIYRLVFNVSKTTYHTQNLVNVDILIKRMDKHLDYNKSSIIAILIGLMQILLAFFHLLSLYLAQGLVNAQRPWALMFQVVYADFLALATTSYYCYYLFLLKERYDKVNECLKDVVGTNLSKKAHKSDEQFLCDYIINCSNIYNVLHLACTAHDGVFGLTLVIIILECLLTIILNVFYFVEAVAAFYYRTHPSWFSYFCIYIAWEMLYVTGILLLIIYFCESTYRKTKRPGTIAHQIINDDISPLVSDTAMRLSKQMVHQVTKFSAGGMFKLQYKLLLTILNFVCTMELILWQTAAARALGEKKQTKM